MLFHGALILVRIAAGLLAAGALSIPVEAAVLVVGHGAGVSPEAAASEARADLARRLQRRAATRFDGGRELPLIGIELARTGAKGAEVLYEARLTRASVPAYERESSEQAQRLRRFDALGMGASPRSPGELAGWLARLDQYRRVNAVLNLWSSAPRPDLAREEAAVLRSAAQHVSPVADPAALARRVKLELDRAGIARARVIAPVRGDAAEVTALSGSIADQLRAALDAPARDEPAAHTLDGRYVRIGARLLVTLFLLDASFNTRRAFVFVLPASADGSAGTLDRGLVRVELPGSGPTALALEVDVRAGRGNRGLYYRPGERDTLLVKLDRPGFYYVVGHVQKAGTRFSYLMEIGEPGAADRFVRRVSAEQANRWQAVGEFTVEAPVGVEAVQVFATSAPPQRMLPATRFDAVRKLHVVGSDPIAILEQHRAKAKQARLAAGEAVLQFSTLP